MQGIHELTDILHKRIGIVSGFGIVRIAVSAAGEGRARTRNLSAKRGAKPP
jgi:hypothetical protein